MMKRQCVRIAKRSLTPDLHCALMASWEDGGSVKASLWPAKKTGQREGLGERYLLVARADTDIEQHDRIEWKDKFYRVLWVRAFPKHIEAMLEKEKG